MAAAKNATASCSPFTRPPLHTVLPPLILGTATFNTQYVADPHSMPYRDIVARAISHGITAFDTSPYYGPSEVLLGNALDALMNPQPTESDPNPVPLPRSSFAIVTKAGRIASTEFDYSPSWIRYSILRSLQRLHTPYLDLVYAHDVEFVTSAEVLAAVRELRRLRDEERIVRYVGISGFPVDTLCDLAEMVYRETGEPLDAVMSYGNFTVQNRRLGASWLAEHAETAGQALSPLARLMRANVDVVLNASILGMGLLTSRGIPADPNEEPTTTATLDEVGKNSAETRPLPSPLAQWHPSPPGLRLACKKLAELAAAAGERLESVAIRWSLGEWARVGAAAGVGVDVIMSNGVARKLGASVCGVSSIAELDETMAEWRGVLSDLEQAKDSARQEKVVNLVRKELWPALGSWIDRGWDSPRRGYVNNRREADRGVVPDDGIVAAYEEARQMRETAQHAPAS
ncbi:D-arabinose 1-dehydrogenase [Madurella mycetomatis]|uniref:D-arabinose 1-dehydrogenase n=1 Tax=Madurella mycetomatis TaxID=100816 RepID=A0A175WBD1_9PEZI|nr:D-arabinose 1-dehydrogenase [Madurella mycetomatis]